MTEQPLTFPVDWTLSGSWARAQNPRSGKSPLNQSQWVVQIDDGNRHRVTFHIDDGELVTDCDCTAWFYDKWCSHVAKLWWDWIRRDAVITCKQTNKNYRSPPPWLTVDRESDEI